MAELCLMASTAYPSSGLFRPEQALQRATKEFRTFSSCPGARQEILRSGSLQIKPHHFEDPWKSTAHLLSSDESINLESTIRGPALINVQDARYESVIFSLGIAEQCRRHDKIWQSFMSASSEEEEEEGLDLSQMSDLTGFQTLPYMQRQMLAPLCGQYLPYNVRDDEAQPSLIYPQTRIYLQKPILDFAGDLASKSLSAMHPDGQVLLAGTMSEMKDIQSIVSEFCLSKNSTKCGDRAMVVPYFSRLDMRKRRTKTHGSALQLEAVTATPVKSPRKTKLKQSSKRKTSSNAGSEKDIHRRNYFHACESLLSLILGNRQEKNAIQSLQKSGPELPQLLTQFSASIAGTGLAVLFSVVCKVASGRVPFTSSKLLNTGFGFGLVWLSWAVNKLRDNIINISKNQSKLGLKDEDMLRKVDRSVNEIFFRAATLMAVVVLRIA